MVPINKKGTPKQALLWLIESGFGLLFCLPVYVIVTLMGHYNMLLHDELFSGGFLMLALLFAMNGMSRTELLLGNDAPLWWKQSRMTKWLHFVHDEGEMAGIFQVVVVLLVAFLTNVSIHFHLDHTAPITPLTIPVSEPLTLLGIMSAAQLAVRNMAPVMGALERIFGLRWAIAIFSLLGSLAGEPSVAVNLTAYVKDRIKDENRAKASVGLGAVIGFGGGLTWFAAPPILIVAAVLQTSFGWTLYDLLLYVGGGCVLSVVVIAWRLASLIEHVEPKRDRIRVGWQLPLLIFVIVANFVAPHEVAVWLLNGSVGLINIVLQLQRYGLDGHGEPFQATWQPLILALLLGSLEIAGQVIDPLLSWVGSGIPTIVVPWLEIQVASAFPGLSDWYQLRLVAFAVGVVLWYLSGFTSHFADNALASRVYISVAIVVAIGFNEIDPEIGSLMAMAVILGSLFGGLALIPANLPNFVIAKIMEVGPGDWAKKGFFGEYYILGAITNLVWMAGWFFLSKDTMTPLVWILLIGTAFLFAGSAILRKFKSRHQSFLQT